MSRPKGSKNKPKKTPYTRKNAGICGLCNESVISTHRHDFCQCSCGNLFVDGGHDYQRYGFDSERENGKSVLWNNSTSTWQTLANFGKVPEKKVKKKVEKKEEKLAKRKLLIY